MLMPSIFGENLLDDFFGEPFGGYDYSESGLMTTDVKDTDKGYEVTMNMPGVKKEDVKAELKDGYLTVSGSKEVSSTEEPKENQKDLEEIPPHVLSQFKIVCVEQIEQVLENALTRMPEKRKS